MWKFVRKLIVQIALGLKILRERRSSEATTTTTEEARQQARRKRRWRHERDTSSLVHYKASKDDVSDLTFKFIISEKKSSQQKIQISSCICRPYKAIEMVRKKCTCCNSALCYVHSHPGTFKSHRHSFWELLVHVHRSTPFTG